MIWPRDRCSLPSVSIQGATQLYVLMQFVCLTALFIFQLGLSHTCVAVCLPCADRTDLQLISFPETAHLGDLIQKRAHPCHLINAGLAEASWKH